MLNLNAVWSATETEYALKHWREGQSAAQVARLLNAAFGSKRTRNSVIGKVHRMGESRPEATNVRKTATRVVMARVAKVKPVPKPKVFSPPRPLPAPVVILADVSFARPWLTRAKSGECHFLLGERHAYLSCCFPTDETYCAAHRQAMGGRRKAWSDKDHRNVARAA